MKIARMNVWIAIQHNSTGNDSIGNHLTEWADCYACHAYASTYNGNETEAATTETTETITFFVRYCSELAAVTTTGYRVKFRGQVYNIRSIDPMNFNRRELKLTCEREAKGKALSDTEV